MQFENNMGYDLLNQKGAVAFISELIKGGKIIGTEDCVDGLTSDTRALSSGIMDLRRLQDTEDVSDTSNIQNNPLKDGQLVEFYQNLFKE